MTRHEMRQSAILLTFERMFTKKTNQEILEIAKESDMFLINKDSIELFLSVDEKKEEIDESIKKHLNEWTIDRISSVSLSVLRVAMYEILFCDDIDTDIAISEAVKITQIYSLKEDVAFVNGLLSSVAKELV